MPLHQLENEMPATDYDRYFAFYRMSPFGSQRTDVNHAIVARTVAQYGGSKNAKIDDYLPQFRSRRFTAEEALAFKAQVEASR